MCYGAVDSAFRERSTRRALPLEGETPLKVPGRDGKEVIRPVRAVCHVVDGEKESRVLDHLGYLEIHEHLVIVRLGARRLVPPVVITMDAKTQAVGGLVVHGHGIALPGLAPSPYRGSGRPVFDVVKRRAEGTAEFLCYVHARLELDALSPELLKVFHVVIAGAVDRQVDRLRDIGAVQRKLEPQGRYRTALGTDLIDPGPLGMDAGIGRQAAQEQIVVLPQKRGCVEGARDPEAHKGLRDGLAAVQRPQ